ncbi:hypothetical protein N0V90_005052 [Kalmusia sp. IMI 367209]|nr:hypothetical protein N0V90_005052 [Kalmusia sp. IMI 367209]
MASATLDLRILRSASAREVTKYLRDVQQNLDDHEVTRDLIHFIEIDSISPSAFAQWLGLSQSPSALRQAFSQSISVEVRKFAIKRLRKLLSSSQWQETWDYLGGTSGLLELWSNFSVLEVKQACRVIASSAKGIDAKLKRVKFTELFVALLPRLFPDHTYANLGHEDDRQLRTLYLRLIPACTGDVVSTMVTDRWHDFEHFRKYLMMSHADTLQALAIQHVFDNHPAGEKWLTPLLSGDYPPTTTPTPGISASMEFSLRLLQRLVTEEAKAPLSSEWFMSKLVEPLLHRALKKKIDWSTIQKVVDFTLAYINRHADAASKLNLSNGGFVHLSGICWSREPEMFTDQFDTVLSLTSSNLVGQLPSFQKIMGLLRGVPQHRRYALLKLYFQAMFKRNIDIEADLKDKVIPPLKHGLLNNLLLPEDALALFTRMRSARGDDKLVTGNIYWYGDSHGFDANMWHAVLLLRSGRQIEASKIAIEGFEACKKAAVSSAGKEQRAIHARSTVDYAVASGSLKLCKEAHLWARRFVRDSLTVKELYQTYTNEGITLLSGIPEPLPDTTCDSSELRHRVQSANEILLFMFDTACLALREPSFNRRHWHGVLGLFASVISRRKGRSADLKKLFSFSDEEMYDILWKDTTKMLIAVEEKGQLPGYEALGVNTVRGILNQTATARTDLEIEEASTFRFFDEFAKARDELWQKHRVSTHPAVAALPEPFPRGLPLQHLIEPYAMSVHDLHSCTPYIAARVDAAVFPDPVAALAPVPEDQEMRDAIGTFIDDYTFALRMMVPDSLNEDEKKHRVSRAWSFATGPLSEERFTTEEAIRYWKTNKLENSFPKFWPREKMLKSQFPDWPLVPEVERSGEIEEWNPVPVQLVDIPMQKLEKATYIDMSKHLGGRSNHATVCTRLQLTGATVPAVSHNKIFSHDRIVQGKALPSIREGQILSALLYIDSILPKSQLLNGPFPSTSHEDLIRYPAVYLDGEFLSNTTLKNTHGIDALWCLDAHLANVPPSLLAHLANNAYRALASSSEKDDGYLDLERTALRLTEMLARCDRPALASKLAIQVIMDRPDNSSWHRQILSRRFFRRIPASAAQDCMSTFADAIITRLEEQTNSRASEKAEADSNGPMEEKPAQRPPFVKITTVKLLAELLGDTQCISQTFALSVLSNLMKKASHIDIRRAVVSSLLGMFQDASSELSEKIITALETVVPIAGNLRERRLVTDLEWANAEATLELPDLDALNSPEETSPMLWSLLSFLKKNPPGSPQFTCHASYMKRIILPIIANLKQQTAKWTSLFLQKHGFDFTAQQELHIPLIPREVEIQHELLRCAPSHLPISFLEEFTEYRTFNITPPLSIAALNKKFEDDPPLKSQPSVKSWLQRYALGLEVTRDGATTFNIASLLDAPTQLTGEITPKAVQEHFLKLYTVLLWHDTETFTRLENQHSAICNFYFSSYTAIAKSWADHYKPIVEAIILFIESIRTRDWERDPNRNPRVLPDPFKLRMRLLQYSAQHSDAADDDEEHCKAFSARVVKIIDQITGGLYHAKFEQLKDALRFVRGGNRLRVACYLGDISKTRLSWLTMQDHLRVELAAGLVREGMGQGSVNKELARRIDALKESWKASESEEVRRVGFLG